ncbi:putative lipoprotein [Synechococcus sp. PROS-U-1]|nr:putative lipoprotein [Synechococcus sp. PROS-U-1]
MTQALLCAVLSLRSSCQIPVAVVPLNGKSTTLISESDDLQGQSKVGS